MVGAERFEISTFNPSNIPATTGKPVCYIVLVGTAPTSTRPIVYHPLCTTRKEQKDIF